MGSGGQPASISVSHQGPDKIFTACYPGSGCLVCLAWGSSPGSWICSVHNPPEEGCRGCVYMWRQLQEKLGPEGSVCPQKHQLLILEPSTASHNRAQEKG